MLLTTIQQVQRLRPHAAFHLLSVFPRLDSEYAQPVAVRIVDARPIALVLCYLPLALMAWPFSRLRLARALLARIPYFDALMRSAAVLDHSGIAFSDGRGIALLTYNVACCLPAIIVGTPVIKLPQALGPFQELPNRVAARFVLRRCQRVFARGRVSASYLGRLGLPDYEQRPDVSFALEMPAQARALARERLLTLDLREPVLAVAPSRLVQRYCSARGIELVTVLSAVVARATALGYRVVIVAHSHGAAGSSNNDVPVCRELAARCAGQARIVDDIRDATLARALIGCAQLLIGSRFHAIVAAVSMGVPALALGWSHKYSEMLSDFGLDGYALALDDISVASVVERFLSLEGAAPQLRPQVAAAADRMKSSVQEMYASLIGRD